MTSKNTCIFDQTEQRTAKYGDIFNFRLSHNRRQVKEDNWEGIEERGVRRKGEDRGFLWWRQAPLSGDPVEATHEEHSSAEEHHYRP